MKHIKLIASFVCAAAVMASCTEKKESAASGADTTKAVIENIMTRTSVREFTGRAIGSDTLEAIVRAGMAAPTGANQQPWAFVVVSDRAALDSLAAADPWANLKTAAAAIVVCGDMQRKMDGAFGEYWIQDCSAASENILLAAHAYGLGGVWYGVYPATEFGPAIRQALGMPGYITPLNVIALGHPAAPAAPKDKWHPEHVHYQRW